MAKGVGVPVRSGVFALLALLLPVLSGAQVQWQERADWTAILADAQVSGTVVVLDERTQDHWVSDEARALTRFTPASTFKVPHLLFALDAGIVHDEFEVFPWDGTRRSIDAWNQDQDLRSSLRKSVVWVYQGFARQLGEERERGYLQRLGYGNAEPSGGVDRFWLDGGLRISAHEQVEFLRRLYHNDLPFQEAHQRLAKDLMIVGADRDWILRAKTGWGEVDGLGLGWWVGWVEWREGAVFFALNIDMPRGGADAPKREAIGRAVLRSIGALPQ